MKYVRLYTGSDGKSHFEDLEISTTKLRAGEWSSETLKATGIIFRETDGEYNLDFHPAPRRQFVVTLEGHVQIEVGDGSKRTFGPGDIMLAEDTHGQGHISRAIDDKPRRSIFLPLE